MDERSLALTGGLFIEAIAGSSYAFSVYSPQLKAELNFTQADIETIGSSGMYGVFIAGLAYDAAGPVVSAFAGAAMSALGYALLWAAATGRVPSTVTAVGFYSFLWSHGSSWLDTAAIATTARNFPHDRGLTIGVSKSLYGLSASVLTLIYSNVYKPDVNTYLLFSGIFITAVGALAGMTLRLVAPANAPPMSRGAKVKLSISFFSIIALALYLGVMSALQNRGVAEANVYYVLPLVPLIGMHCVQVLPSAWFERLCGGGAAAVEEDAQGAASEGAIVKPAAGDSLRDGLLQPMDTQPPATFNRKGASVFETALHVDFIIFLILLCSGSGGGVTLINNVGDLTKALGGAADSQDVYIVIISIFNCLGRIVIGAASDSLSSYVSRPGFFTICVASMAGVMTLCTFADLNSLYVAVAWAGFSQGTYWALGPAFLAERFGPGSFASINALSALVSALASYGFSAVMAPYIYQANIVGGGTICYGANCFRLSFIIMALVNAGAACLGLYLTCSLRGMYRAPHGKAIPFEQVDVEHPPHGCTQVLQRALLRVCCCGAGRWLLTGCSDVHECEAYMEARSASVTGRSKSVDATYTTINA